VNKAIITDNKVFCSNNHHNYKVKDYKEVEIAGNKYTKFLATCKECEDIFYYFAQLRVTEDEYFMFDEAESEIKESEEEGIKNEN
jgi:hypothetical protein